MHKLLKFNVTVISNFVFFMALIILEYIYNVGKKNSRLVFRVMFAGYLPHSDVSLTRETKGDMTPLTNATFSVFEPCIEMDIATYSSLASNF